MTNKVAIVTGANKGLGLAIVKGLCEKYDGTVYLTSRDTKRGRDACEELKKIGLHPKYYQLDVTDNDSVRKFCTFIKEEHKQIDIVINNAAILFLKDAEEPRLYQAEQTILVNFTALVNFCEAILPMIKVGGKIVNISSSSAHLSRIPSEKLRNIISSPDLTLEALKELISGYVEAVRENKDIEEGWGDSPYVVSKVGVNAYTFHLHRRLANRGIVVNCVHPGYVMSDMTRGGGNVSPEQGAMQPLLLALESQTGGRYVWHDGTEVPWDGPDPRGYIDGRQ
ncbi:carbonyl reductase [NADPH] 1-like [Galleria mellonella]|uniref:Carbonyl reductase [NADPH] 1-like n=1 Tax=Galleria mellonella TaxID=7137 RepID=A0ABM3MP55_GALME|nr:carbonyl reductase [NADPH] 1-like [Galleria mellonella]XP_052753156.1 carbonyl reductase [NADPH] 1-like [Galleria mellonella]